jgi:hypothetical protein
MSAGDTAGPKSDDFVALRAPRNDSARLAAELRGDEAAQTVQLHMFYALEPPFDNGMPETAPGAILEQARQSLQAVTAQREETARRAAVNLGIQFRPRGRGRPR